MKFKICENGDKHCFNDKGQCHNIIEPAIIWTEGNRFWRRNDLAHRLDGPASMYPNGDKFWYWLGESVSKNHYAVLSNMRFFTRRVKI